METIFKFEKNKLVRDEKQGVVSYSFYEGRKLLNSISIPLSEEKNLTLPYTAWENSLPFTDAFELFLFKEKKKVVATFQFKTEAEAKAFIAKELSDYQTDILTDVLSYVFVSHAKTLAEAIPLADVQSLLQRCGTKPKLIDALTTKEMADCWERQPLIPLAQEIFAGGLMTTEKLLLRCLLMGQFYELLYC